MPMARPAALIVQFRRLEHLCDQTLSHEKHLADEQSALADMRTGQREINADLAYLAKAGIDVDQARLPSNIVGAQEAYIRGSTARRDRSILALRNVCHRVEKNIVALGIDPTPLLELKRIVNARIAEVSLLSAGVNTSNFLEGLRGGFVRSEGPLLSATLAGRLAVLGDHAILKLEVGEVEAEVQPSAGRRFLSIRDCAAELHILGQHFEAFEKDVRRLREKRPDDLDLCEPPRKTARRNEARLLFNFNRVKHFAKGRT
jgi:hypothetical protein